MSKVAITSVKDRLSLVGAIDAAVEKAHRSLELRFQGSTKHRSSSQTFAITGTPPQVKPPTAESSAQ